MYFLCLYFCFYLKLILIKLLGIDFIVLVCNLKNYIDFPECYTERDSRIGIWHSRNPILETRSVYSLDFNNWDLFLENTQNKKDEWSEKFYTSRE